jgi:hypothetical protein
MEARIHQALKTVANYHVQLLCFISNISFVRCISLNYKIFKKKLDSLHMYQQCPMVDNRLNRIHDALLTSNKGSNWIAWVVLQENKLENCINLVEHQIYWVKKWRIAASNVMKLHTSEGAPDNLIAAAVASAYSPLSTSFLTSVSASGAFGLV